MRQLLLDLLPESPPTLDNFVAGGNEETLAALSGCGYNAIQQKDEAVNAAWSEVLNQYQRRADLVPNLVNVVKGYAAHEKDVLTQVTEARARVGSVQVNADDPQSLKQYQEAQGALSSALSRLLVVSENYPNLKADTGFRDLQAQLEGTENRITVARNRYIQTVQEYNITVRRFPVNLTARMFGYQTKPTFTVISVGAMKFGLWEKFFSLMKP